MNTSATTFMKLDPKTNGLFISFEGIDGCGKSTQIKILKNNLEQMGYNPVVFREPGGTKFGEKLRESILTSKKKLSPLARHIYFVALGPNYCLKKYYLFYLHQKTTLLF